MNETEALAALQRAFQPLIQAITEACNTVMPAIWNAYREAGSPYGEDDWDGLHQWLEEQADSRGRTEARQ